MLFLVKSIVSVGLWLIPGQIILGSGTEERHVHVLPDKIEACLQCTALVSFNVETQ